MVDKYLKLAIGGGDADGDREEEDWNGNVEVVCRDDIYNITQDS